MSDVSYQVTRVGKAHVVSLSLAESTDSNEFDLLNDQILAIFDQQPRAHWVLDLSGVNYMGSSALGLMVNIRQRVIKTGGQLVICGMSPQLTRIFKTCCLERLFTITKTREEAVA